jgi:gluconate 2-dehydrogenase alpha chain
VGVQYVDEKGEEVFQPADLVILSTFTLNNSRLLMLSGIGEQYDPKTGKGTLGANFTHQISYPAAVVYFDKPMNRFMGGGGAGMTVSDFDGDVFDHSNVPFIRGGNFRASCGGSRPIGNFGNLPPSVKPRWGSEWKKQSIYYFDRVGQIGFAGEHLAYKGNYLDLDPVYKDKNGDPLLRVTIDWTDNERKMADFMTQKAVEIGKALGAKEIKPWPGMKRYDTTRYQSTHVQGGTVMGTSPADSVVNIYGQHWQASNLFVVGSSVYPQNPAPNPTTTIIALAYRTADAVVDRYLKKPGMIA